MAQEGLTIDVERVGDRSIYALHGSLDIATSPSVRAALQDESASGEHDVVVDLRELEFLDSTGLGALIGAQRRALERGAQVRLVVTEGPIARLLNITGLVRVFGVYHTVDAALKDQDRVAAPL